MPINLTRKAQGFLLALLSILVIGSFGCNVAFQSRESEVSSVPSSQSVSTLSSIPKETDPLTVRITPSVVLRTSTFTPTSEIRPLSTYLENDSNGIVITPTKYPVQKLTTEQKMTVMDFLIETSSCLLPCWNGLTPGKSSTVDIQSFFARLGHDFDSLTAKSSQENGERSVEIRDFPTGTFTDPLLIIYVRWQKQIVNLIEINFWDHPEQINIKQAIEKLGSPDQIMVLEWEGNKYSILLHYVSKNTLIEIRGNKILSSSDHDLPFQVCVNDTTNQTINARFYAEDISSEINEKYNQFPWTEWDTLLGLSKEELLLQIQQPDICLPYP